MLPGEVDECKDPYSTDGENETKGHAPRSLEEWAIEVKIKLKHFKLSNQLVRERTSGSGFHLRVFRIFHIWMHIQFTTWFL